MSNHSSRSQIFTCSSIFSIYEKTVVVFDVLALERTHDSHVFVFMHTLSRVVLQLARAERITSDSAETFRRPELDVIRKLSSRIEQTSSLRWRQAMGDDIDTLRGIEVHRSPVYLMRWSVGSYIRKSWRTSRSSILEYKKLNAKDRYVYFQRYKTRPSVSISVRSGSLSRLTMLEINGKLSQSCKERRIYQNSMEYMSLWIFYKYVIPFVTRGSDTWRINYLPKNTGRRRDDILSLKIMLINNSVSQAQSSSVFSISFFVSIRIAGQTRWRIEEISNFKVIYLRT